MAKPLLHKKLRLCPDSKNQPNLLQNFGLFFEKKIAPRAKKYHPNGKKSPILVTLFVTNYFCKIIQV